MTPVTFVEADLLSDISRDELDGIAKELVTITDPAPIATTITEERQRFYDYTRRYVIPDDRAKRLIRPLVLFGLYARLNSRAIPKYREDKFKDAMAELRDIRDGKFNDLSQADDPQGGAIAAGAAWGSEARVATARQSGTTFLDP